MQFRWISKGYAEIEALKKAYKMKLILVIILICLAVAFAVNLRSRIDAAGEHTLSFNFRSVY